MSASLAVQQLVASALVDVPGLTGIHDGPAPDAAPPYATIGADLVTDWSHKTGTGHEHRITVTVWDAGPGVAAVKALAGAVEARLAGVSGEALGHRIVSALLLRSLALGDAEGWSRVVIDFRIRSVAI